MDAVNMHEAKSRLSALVEAVESGREAEVVIARNGKPAARLVPVVARDVSKRIGVAKGQFTMPGDEAWAAMDKEIEALFNDSEWYPGEPRCGCCWIPRSRSGRLSMTLGSAR